MTIIMPTIKQKNRIEAETVSAIFSIIFLMLFILANFFVGFVLPLYLLAVTVSFVLTLAYPRSGLFALVFLTIIFNSFFTLSPIIIDKTEYKLFLPDIIILGMLLGLFFRYLAKRKEDSKKIKKADGVLGAFIVLNIIYYFVSVYIFNSSAYLSFSSLKNYAFYSLLYFITYLLIANREQMNRLLKFYFSAAVLIVGFILFGIVSGKGLWTEITPLSTDGVRILAFYHGLYITLAFIPVILFAIFQKRKNRLLIFLGLFWAVGIVGTLMRHLWIALGLAFILIYFLLKKEQKFSVNKIVAKAALLVCVACILFFYAALMTPQSRLSETIFEVKQAIAQRSVSIANAGSDESFAWRAAVWQSAWEKYQENFIFGIGTGQVVSIEIGNYHDFVEVRNMHNSFLTIIMQFGVVGIFLFLYFVYLHFRMLFEADDFRANFYRLAFLSVLVVYLVSFMLQPYLETNLLAMFFWINLGLIRAIDQQKI